MQFWSKTHFKDYWCKIFTVSIKAIFFIKLLFLAIYECGGYDNTVAKFV
jgi:hypothetical protein